MPKMTKLEVEFLQSPRGEKMLRRLVHEHAEMREHIKSLESQLAWYGCKYDSKWLGSQPRKKPEQKPVNARKSFLRVVNGGVAGQ